MEKKKKILFFMLNVVYILVGTVFLFYFYNKFSPSSSIYDNSLFTIIVLLYVIMCELTNSVLSKILSFIYVSLFGLYMMAQNIYHSVFQQYFRISYVLSLKKEVTTFKSSVFEFVSIKDFIPFIIFGIISILFIVLYFSYLRKVKISKKILLVRIAVLLLLLPCYSQYNHFNSMLEEAKHQEDFFQLNKTDYYLYDTVYSSDEFVDKFGLITFCYRDIEKANDVEDYSQYISDVNDLLSNKPEPIDNDFSDVFKGKDVFFIQAESYNKYALDEELTPAIYRLATDGISVNGFNTPALPGSTSDTEFMTNISIIPDSEEYASCYRYIDNTYDVTLASIFKKAGYVTDIYHNCYGIYYNRNVLFTNEFGYDNFRDCTLMGLEDACDDYTFGSDLYWMYENTTSPFMAYWITYSGHQPYSLDSVGVKDEYISLIRQKYPELDDEHVSYFAKNMDLDRSIENIISTAKLLNRENNLVIVFFGDHITKGLEMDGKEQTELYIYCPANEFAIEYSKPSTCLDILPTIANMFGLEYDNKKVLGRDIFDETYHGYCFTPYLDFITNDYKCDSKGNIEDFNGNAIIDKDTIEEASKYLEYKRVSKIIQKLDYFKQ